MGFVDVVCTVFAQKALLRTLSKVNRKFIKLLSDGREGYFCLGSPSCVHFTIHPSNIADNSELAQAGSEVAGYSEVSIKHTKVYQILTILYLLDLSRKSSINFWQQPSHNKCKFKFWKDTFINSGSRQDDVQRKGSSGMRDMQWMSQALNQERKFSYQPN